MPGGRLAAGATDDGVVVSIVSLAACSEGRQASENGLTELSCVSALRVAVGLLLLLLCTLALRIDFEKLGFSCG